jgi:septum formation topological specificity factor MinE
MSAHQRRRNGVVDWVLWSELERRADAVLPARKRPYEITCDEWGELFDLLETAQRDGSKEATQWLAVMCAVRRQKDTPPVLTVSRPNAFDEVAKYFKSTHGEAAISVGRGCVGVSIRTRSGLVHWNGRVHDMPGLVEQYVTRLSKLEYRAPASHIESDPCAAIRILN